MPPTHNKLKNIEREVFSSEASSFTKEHLLTLKNELMETYADANNYTQAREKWHAVDKQINDLINLLPPPKEKWYSLFLKHPIVSAAISGIILLLITTYLSLYIKVQEQNHLQDMSQTSINKISNKQSQ